MFDIAPTVDEEITRRSKYLSIVEKTPNFEEDRNIIISSLSNLKSQLTASPYSQFHSTLIQTLDFILKLHITNEYLLKKLDIVLSNHQKSFRDMLSTGTFSGSSLAAPVRDLEILGKFQSLINTWKTEGISTEENSEEIPSESLDVTPLASQVIPMRVFPIFVDPEIQVAAKSPVINTHEMTTPLELSSSVTVDELSIINSFDELDKLLYSRCEELIKYLDQFKDQRIFSKFAHDFNGILNSQTEISSANISTFIRHIQAFLRAISGNSKVEKTISDSISKFIVELDLFVIRFEEISSLVKEI
jgi:hypothetical protein